MEKEISRLEYPKPVMKVYELMELGLAREFLIQAFHSPKQNFAWKMNPMAKNSPILFETNGLEEYRINCIKNQRMINQHSVGVM